VQLLLSSVFGLSDVTNNIRWESYEAISDHPGIGWTIPHRLCETGRRYRKPRSLHSHVGDRRDDLQGSDEKPFTWSMAPQVSMMVIPCGPVWWNPIGNNQLLRIFEKRLS
jgi:hypothetical protein